MEMEIEKDKRKEQRCRERKGRSTGRVEPGTLIMAPKY
jgi:hypothetical protein